MATVTFMAKSRTFNNNYNIGNNFNGKILLLSLFEEKKHKTKNYPFF